MFFDNIFDAFYFDEFLKEKRNISQGSRYMYLRAVEKFLTEESELDDVESYNRFIIKYAIKKRSTYIYSALKAFVEFYVKDAGKRSTIIAHMIKPEIPTVMKKERKYLDEKEIVTLINNLRHDKHKIIAIIQDLTGIRAGDVLKIQRGNIIPEIYEEKNVLKIIVEGKGQKRNVVYIHDDVVQALIVNFIIKNFYTVEYYFIEEKHKIIDDSFRDKILMKRNYTKYHTDLKNAMRLMGLQPSDFATHDYRRCYARRVWTRYKDIQILQDLLNHQNPATTMRYLKHSGLKNIDYHKEMQTN